MTVSEKPARIGEKDCMIRLIKNRHTGLHHAQLRVNDKPYDVTGVKETAKEAEVLGDALVKRYQNALANKDTDNFGVFIAEDFERGEMR